MFHSWSFLLLLLNLPFTHSSATHPPVQSQNANQFINLLQISTATGGEAAVASSATGAAEPSSISTTPTGTSATGAATGAAEEPMAIAPKIETPLPKTKTITVGCGNDVHLKLESASLKVSFLYSFLDRLFFSKSLPMFRPILFHSILPLHEMLIIYVLRLII